MNNKIDWKSKLSSRKFWAAIIAVLVTVLTMTFNDVIDPQIVALLKNMILALCFYIGGESLVDAVRNIFPINEIVVENSVASEVDDSGDTESNE